MDNIKNDKYFFEIISSDIKQIKEYFNNKSYQDFIKDKKSLDAILFRLVQICENVKHISVEFKKEHNKIEWGNIMGFRNGLVHVYGETNFNDVYKIVAHDLDELLDAIS